MNTLGDWRIRAETNELCRGDTVVRVEPKAMDVLMALMRAGGRVLTRDELLAAAWPGVVVGDEALTQAIIKLRRALGDDSRAPRYIETIPKRGYRIVPGSVATRGNRRWRWLSATAVACVAAALVVLAAGDSQPAHRAEAARNPQAQALFTRAQARLLVRGASENEEARALELAETARLIDPGAPDVYWVLGFVQVQERRHPEAIASLRRAIALDASFADAYALLGGIYTYIGQPGESIPLLRTAMRLKPDGGYLYFLLLGRAYLFQDDVEQALINLRAAAMRNPADVETRAYLAAALAASGEHSRARWESDEIRALRPDFSAQAWLATYPMADARQERRLASLLADAGL